MLDFYEMMRRYRDHPEAYQEDTIMLLKEILRVLNLQSGIEQKQTALLRATKSLKEYQRIEMKLCVNLFFM
jgi:hypothetical protein